MQKCLENIERLATLGHHNSAIITEITDSRKFTTKTTLYKISSFHFYRCNQFTVIPVAYTLHTRNLQIFCVQRGLTTRHITLTSLSLRKPIIIDY